jgi:periplasmic protein TonB
MRFVLFLAISGIITLTAFLMMQQLLSSHGTTPKPESPTGGMDFIRLIPETEVQKKQRQLPKKTPPPKERPLPPMPTPAPTKKPPPPQLDVQIPHIKVPLNLKNTLFTGNFSLDNGNTSLQADEEVIPLVRIAPRYPRRAARSGIEGWVKLSLQIEKDGSVSKAMVTESNPPRIFDRAAIKSVLRWKFKPKMVAGKAVSRMATQRVDFKLGKRE